MINFEPCNPPLIDPLFLKNISLITDMLVVKPTIHLEKEISDWRREEKTTPLRPIAIRPTLSFPLSSTPALPSGRFNTTPPNVSISPNTGRYDSSTPNVSLSPPSRRVDVGNYTVTPNRTVTPPPNRLATSLLYSSPSHRCLDQPGACTSPNCPNRITSSFSERDLTTPQRDVTAPQRDVTPPTLRYSPILDTRISSTPLNKKSSRPTPYTPKISPEGGKSDKRRNDRHGISESQSSTLKDWFSRYTYLTIEKRKVVSGETGLPEKTVMYWFQNQRRKVKRQNGGVSIK